jgi:hypothetical protein
MTMTGRVVLSCFAVLAGCLAGPAAAATLTYPGAAPCNTTLQACVTGASAGDTIQLATNGLIAEFVTIDRSLTIEPAPGFAPSVQGLFGSVTTTDLSLTVRDLAGLNTLRTVLAPGGGNLNLQVLNNVITGSDFNGAVEVDAGTGSTGTYGTATVLVSGNHISQTASTSCTDAVAIVGVPASFDATVVGNDFTLTNLSQCGAVDAVVGGGATATALIDRNLVHGSNFDYGLLVRNFGANPGNPGGMLTAQVSNNLVWGQFGNTGAPAGIVVTADGNNAGLAAQLVNNTIADNRLGVLVAVRDDLGAVVTGGMFNNIVAFNSQFGVEIETGATGFANAHNLVFGNGSDFFTPGAQTLASDPLFTNRAARDYTLSAGSPAVNSGLDSALPASFTLDLAGNARRVGTIDRGAYESAFVATAAAGPVPTLQPLALALLVLLLGAVGAMRARR